MANESISKFCFTHTQYNSLQHLYNIIMHTYGNVTPPGFSGFCEKANGKERYRDAHTNRERKRMNEVEKIGVGRKKDILL